MSSERLTRPTPQAVLAASAVAVPVALVALLGRVGADARWLAALGHAISAHGEIPAGVPFAALPSGHWPNALVLAELIFGWLERLLGDRGLMLAQLAAVAAALGILSRDARQAGAPPRATAAALLLAVAGALPALVVARVQLFSLVLFPLLLALLRAEARAPSKRIWLAVPLLALWSNLHGAALLGLLTLAAHLLLARGRREPLHALALALAGAAALMLTPALLGTFDYYHGLLVNLAAQRGAGMWRPLSPSAPLDLLLIAAAAALIIALRRRRPPPWELATAAVLALLTVKSSRNGVWLTFLLVAPAALAWGARSERPRLARILAPALPVALVAIAFGLIRGPVPSGASPRLIASAIRDAAGTPVLASDGIDEQVALAGARVLMGNPIDAFRRADQAAYLDWAAGSPSGARELRERIVRVVLVTRGSAAQRLTARAGDFAAVAGDRRVVMYERRAAAPAPARSQPARLASRAGASAGSGRGGSRRS